MRFRRIGPLVIGAIAIIGGGVALAAHPQVDPAAVPTGFLTAHTRINDVPTTVIQRALRSRRTDVFMEHVRFGPGEVGPVHTHPGPGFVVVVGGALTSEEDVRGRCRKRTYVRGTGFVDQGRPRVHRLRAGPAGAEYYVTSLLPRRTGPNQRPAQSSAC